MKTNKNTNIAHILHRMLLQSEHTWLYAYLQRGGDTGELYLSPKQILDASESLAHIFIDKVPENSGVILSLDHGPDFLIALLACFFAKRTAITAPLPRFESNSLRLRSICDTCNHAFILTKAHYFDAFAALYPENSNALHSRLVCLDQLKTEYTANAAFNAQTLGELPGLSAPADTPMIIQFTSGSTSTPKGAVITAQNIIDNQREVAKRWRFQVNKKLLTWLPYFHDMGLFGGLIYPLMDGQRVMQMDPLHFIQKPQRWLRAISQFKISITGGPAFAFELCNELPAEKIPDDLDLSSWDVGYCGADYVPARTMRVFRERFTPHHLQAHTLTPVYGLAEATLFIAGQPNTAQPSPRVYSGNLTEGCYLGDPDRPKLDIRAQDSDAILPEGSIGEVCFHGESVSQHYVKQRTPPHTNGVLRTGDLGFIEDGYLYLCGRIKDILVLSGLNIPPTTIEQIAASVDDRLNPHAAAAFQPRIDSSDVVLLIEVKKSASNQLTNIEAIRSEIAYQIQQKTAISLAQITFLRRGELMRTSSGKVQRKQVATHFNNGHSFIEVRHADS